MFPKKSLEGGRKGVEMQEEVNQKNLGPPPRLFLQSQIFKRSKFNPGINACKSLSSPIKM